MEYKKHLLYPMLIRTVSKITPNIVPLYYLIREQEKNQFGLLWFFKLTLGAIN